MVSLAALGVGLPKASPAPAAASGNAVLVRQSSKGVRRLSEFIAADVIRAQRVVRQCLMRKRWGRLVSDVKNHSSSLYARLRNETLKEIIQSEESYLSHLIAVVRVRN